MKSWLVAVALGLNLLSGTLGKAETGGRLRVFFVDVEGGQATLFVAPGGESLLVDTGWPDRDGRDADRIVAAAKQAGLARIDTVLLTHYHDDHAGGVPQLVSRIPVGMFVDHGPNREQDHGATEHGYAEYQKVLAAGPSKHMVARPGDVLPFRGIEVKVISADGALLSNPLAGAGQANEFCATTETRPADQTENGRSLGIEVTFGKLKLLDLGDLTWDKEMQLMCPVNRLGPVDVYIVSHHGWYQSSSPALVEAIRPRVAIMDNGETKGGSKPTFATLHSAKIEALWQLHYSPEAGELNSPPDQIANLQGAGSTGSAAAGEKDRGFALDLTGSPDGSFAVHNARNGLTVQYPAPGPSVRSSQ